MITRQFGTEERSFKLLVDQWRNLEKARDCGLGEIAQRLAPLVQFKASKLDGDNALMRAITSGFLGAARLDDVREPILQGLIGAGLTSTMAALIVRAVFDEEVNKGKGPLLAWCDLAFEIVTDAIIGLPDEPRVAPPGETPADGAKAKPARRSRTAKRVSAKSMASSAP